jgi:hypothetical protein
MNVEGGDIAPLDSSVDHAASTYATAGSEIPANWCRSAS